MNTRILIVDDHEIVRVGLRTLLDSEEGLLVVGEASDGPSAVRQAAALSPDVVVMDVRLGAMDGIQACREIKSNSPAISVLILTSFASDDAVLSALMAGASGFLIKNTSRADFVRAVRVLASGQSLLDPAVTRKIIEQLVSIASKSVPEELSALSPREREVLVRLAQGDTNRQIAESLVISEATARHHVSNVLDKLGLHRRSEAAALAARLRLGAAGD